MFSYVERLDDTAMAKLARPFSSKGAELSGMGSQYMRPTMPQASSIAVRQSVSRLRSNRCPESRGQSRGSRDSSSLHLTTMRYSLRRALSLDSVDGCTHNPTVVG